MDAETIKSFVRRDRSAVEALKQRHWARQYRERGAEATFRAGQLLREYACRVRPDWPTERDRAEDLAHHIELKRQLDGAADAFRHR